MRTLLLWALLLAPLLAQDKDNPTIPKDVIKDFKYQLKDIRKVPKPGAQPPELMSVEEVTLILAGDEAIPVNIEKKIFDLRGVKASYFTVPDADKNRQSKEIQISADRGRFDNDARTLKLQDHVRVVKKNDDEKPPQVDTVLTGSSLLLRFTKVFQCPKCRKAQTTPARCAEHGIPLKETTVTNIEMDKDFLMAGPEGILSGEGLVTDDALKREYHITKNGFVEFSGNAAAMSGEKKAPAAPEAKFTQIFSRGPLHITGDEVERTVIGHDGVRVDRIDATGTLTTLSQDMTLVALRPDGMEAPVEIEKVDAKGQVQLEGVLFADGTYFRTTSDTLLRVPGKELKSDITDLTSTGDTLVHVKTGLNTIEARTVRIKHNVDPTKGKHPEDDYTKGEFTDVARSDFNAGTQHFALACGKLDTLAFPNAGDRAELRTIEAHDHVVLGGLLAKPADAPPEADPGKALADAFYWDLAEKRGRLEGKPFVRITQGPSTIVAPLVLLESPSIFVLKGPKQVHLLQEHDGKKEEYRASCAGDMVMDQEAHRLWMRDDCVIRTQEMLLRSPRVNARLTEDNKGMESLLALGGVSTWRVPEHTMIYGDRLAYRFKDQDLKVYGLPKATVDTGRSTSTQEEIRVYEKKSPKSGQMVRYTEMIGSGEGVRMEIDERPPAPKPEDKP